MILQQCFTHQIEPGKLFNIPEQPLNAMLDVTNVCNNKCVYCYNSLPSRTPAHPDFQLLNDIVSLLGSTGTKEILYLGGEPTLHPAFIDLLAVGKSYGLFQRLVSNGSRLAGIGFCDQLKAAGINEIGISFHSSDESVHDRITQRAGSFREALTAIERCCQSGINAFVQYSPNMLNKKNDILLLGEMIRQISGTADLFFDINRLLPLGCGEISSSIFLSGNDWFELLMNATELEALNLPVRVELTPFCWLKAKSVEHKIADQQLEKISRMNRGCFMWIAQLPLDCHGRIKFCPAGPAVGPSILNVSWPDFWLAWEKFTEYRNSFWNDTCIDFKHKRACKFFYRCLGGCKYSIGDQIRIDCLSQALLKSETNQ
ncbi:MAG: radical SAM protein [Candidatus Wallbacteria bacterium]|nr:radical SAM protein [Candidatus Wallbacteria bacterium]